MKDDLGSKRSIWKQCTLESAVLKKILQRTLLWTRLQELLKVLQFLVQEQELGLEDNFVDHFPDQDKIKTYSGMQTFHLCFFLVLTCFCLSISAKYERNRSFPANSGMKLRRSSDYTSKFVSALDLQH